MIRLCQKNRQATIEMPSCPDTFKLQRFAGTESLSQPYFYTADVLSANANLRGDAIVGQPVSVAYYSEEGRERWFNGVVSRIEYNQQVEEPVNAASYTLEIVPQYWLLKHNRDCQIFQEQSVPDIVRAVFRKAGIRDFRFQLNEVYPKREYCVQYNESDFDFVSRLLEEEGIFYYFEHTKNNHTLVMADSPAGYFTLDDEEVRYSPEDRMHEQQLTCWRHAYEFRPGRVAQCDFNFKKPTDSLRTQDKLTLPYQGSSDLEVFEYPGRYVEGAEGDRLTRVRKEEIQAEHDRATGSGAYISFSPGGKFRIAQHARSQEEGKQYVITEITTRFASNLGFDSFEEEDYCNEFTCIPAETPFRPRRNTPKPFLDGPQTAIVVTDGQEIVVDEHARVKVQFHWDRYGNRDINSSCWIRVSQVHAGQGWGMVDIPRKDEEVIVSFLDGDPDRPIITGRVYNGLNQVPFGLKGAGANKDNKTRRGNTTKSYGSGGYNEMSMDDTAGKEQIRIHGQNNMDTTVQNDQTLTVNNDRTKTIANNETNSIGVDQTSEIGSNRKTSVGDNDTTNVAADQTASVGGSQTTNVSSNQTNSVGQVQSNNVGLVRNEMVGVASNEMVGIAKATTIGAVQNTAVGYMSFEQVGMTKKIVAGSKIEFICGASKISLDSGGKVEITGTEFLFGASGPVKINGAVIDLN
jgi:type VI secretion system secreted protein VgrG